MTTKIKVAYNWIGPRGPLWNTELPTIYEMAAACENVKVDSSNYWVDDTWTKIFKVQRNHFELSPSTYLEDEDVFIYPYSTSWRIPFQHYFLHNAGLLEFSHIGHHVMHQIRRGKGFLLIDISGEAWTNDDQLDLMHSYFQNKHLLPLNKIIYLTGTMNVNDLYDDYCRRRGIGNNHYERLKLISYSNSQPFSIQLSSEDYQKNIEPLHTYDTEQVPEKLFLSWNRRFRRHRTNLALGLDKAGLVDRSYYAMRDYDPEVKLQRFDSTVNIYSDPLLGITNEDVENFIKKLPLKLDDEESINEMCADHDFKIRPFYRNSLVSLVTETNFDQQQVTLTEKSYKPSREKHPFIIVGSAGSLKAMHEQGYKTFSEFWDESYDECLNGQERMYRIIEVCKFIASWNHDQIIDFKRRVKPILEHNYNRLKIDPSILVAESIANHIRSNV